MKKENVEDISCYRISLTPSSVYTVFNLTYFRFAKKKMAVLHHKQHSTYHTYLETFQKKLLKIQSIAQRCWFMFTDKQRGSRKTAGTSAYL
jgi:hypothetical protein